jgi:hypothetical protein
LCVAPRLDHSWLALTGAPKRALQAEADRFEQTSDMGRMVGDAKGLLDDLADTCTPSDLAAKAKGLRATIEQAGELSELHFAEACWRARGNSPSQAIYSVGCGTLEPVTDRALGDRQGFGDARLAPALLMQLPSVQPTAFAPIGRRWCEFGIHA